MIIFLYGAETYLSRKKLKEFQNEFLKKVDPSAQSVSALDGASANLQAIAEQINTGTLFATKRLVVVDNIFQNKKDAVLGELADYLKKSPAKDDVAVIFWDEEVSATKAGAKKLFAFLSRQKYAQEFKALTDSEKLVFIKKAAAESGADIKAPAASRLIALSGGDLWLLSREIKKLANYAAEKKIIDVTDIETMTAGAFSENIFVLTDALSARNKSLAIKLFAEQEAAGLSREYILSMLIRQFKILAQIKAALLQTGQADKIASELKLHPFVVKKGLAQAKNFSESDLKNILNRLIRLDFLNKTGASDLETELLLLFAGL